MRYLVTGVNGQLGYDVIRELNFKGEVDYLGIDREELDITSEEKVNEFILNYKPDVIIHCAAYTNVNKAEEDYENAYNVNVLGTRYLVNASNKINAKFIYISTDYVFDGEKEGLYEVTDTPNPLNVYGKTKLLGEKEALKGLKSFIVRTSWVFGINGNNFVKTMLNLSEKYNEVSVVKDQVGSPTYTVDLAKLLVNMANTEKYGLYHANNSNYCSWAEFAKAIFELSGKDTKVKGILTSEYPTPAKRPLNSKLSKKSLEENGFELLPTWEDATKRYILELKK